MKYYNNTLTFWENIRNKSFDKMALKYKLVEELPLFTKPRSMSEWNKNEKTRDKVMKKYPFKAFVFIKFPDFLEYIAYMPFKYYYDVKYYIRYRLFDKYHIVNTGHKPGYIDTDTRMEGALWTLLVEFVEEELAWMEVCFTDDKKLYKRSRFFGKFKSRELGLKHLNWSFKNAENLDMKMLFQGIKDSYLYYKDKRPKLVKKIDDMWISKNVSSKYEQISKLEQELIDTDTLHLTNLIKYRKGMWT